MRYLDWDLIIAARTGNVKLAKHCIENGADARQIDAYQRSALQNAAFIKNSEIVEMLLPISNFDATDRNGMTAFAFATIHYEKDTVDIMQAYFDENPSAVGMKKSSSRMAESKLEHRFVVACCENNFKIAKDCLDKGVDPNVTYYEDPILCKAVFNCDEAFIKLLVEVSDCKVVDPHGSTPLHAAVRYEKLDAIRALLPHTDTDRINLGMAKAKDYAKSKKNYRYL